MQRTKKPDLNMPNVANTLANIGIGTDTGTGIGTGNGTTTTPTALTDLPDAPRGPQGRSRGRHCAASDPRK